MSKKDKHGKHSNNPFSDENHDEEVKDETTPQPMQDEYKEKYEQLNNQYLRLAADFDNYRKRHSQEMESALKYGAEETLKKMLEVLDNFDRAEKSLEGVEDTQKVKEAFELVHKQVIETLSKLGLEKIEVSEQIFDPNLHDAVMQTPTNEKPEHTILQELQKGYKLADKVLRPSLVNVAVKE